MDMFMIHRLLKPKGRWCFDCYYDRTRKPVGRRGPVVREEEWDWNWHPYSRTKARPQDFDDYMERMD